MIEDSGYSDVRVEEQIKSLLRLATGHDCGTGPCRQAGRAISAMKEILRAEFNRGLASALQETPEKEVSDESVQVIHLRLCQRATELASPIAALEEAAEEIAEQSATVLALTAQLEGQRESQKNLVDRIEQEMGAKYQRVVQEASGDISVNTAFSVALREEREESAEAIKELQADLLRLRRLLEERDR